jgi:hypothetical protein
MLHLPKEFLGNTDNDRLVERTQAWGHMEALIAGQHVTIESTQGQYLAGN